MATFAETIASYADQDPLDPNTFLQQMWPQLSPSQQELFSTMLAQRQNTRRDVAVQGGQGNLIDAMAEANKTTKKDDKKGGNPLTQPAPRSQFKGNFVPAGVSAKGALSGQDPGTSKSGYTRKVNDNLTIRDVQGTDGTVKFENIQTGNEVQIQPDSPGIVRGGFAEVGQPTAGGAAAQTLSGTGGTFKVDSTAANYQSPFKQRIKLVSGEWIDVG